MSAEDCYLYIKDALLNPTLFLLSLYLSLSLSISLSLLKCKRMKVASNERIKIVLPKQTLQIEVEICIIQILSKSAKRMLT